MKTRSVPDNTPDPGHALRVGLLTYAGVSLLTMFAAIFVSVTVYPSVRWSLHAQSATNLPRAFIASSLAGMSAAVIITGCRSLIRRFEETQH